MKKYFARLNPLERRFVVGVLVVLFIVVNLMFVTPHFGDWGKVRNRLEQARKKQVMYDTEIAQLPTYESAVRALEKDGATVPQEDQSIDFQRAVQSQAALSGVRLISNAQQKPGTNQFFVEQFHTISVQAGERELVDFLYNLGSSSSMIRVRNFSLRPDPPRRQLSAVIRLVASYQKKSAPRPAAPAAPASPVNKTATPTVKKP